jgi:acetate kinase
VRGTTSDCRGSNVWPARISKQDPCPVQSSDCHATRSPRFGTLAVTLGGLDALVYTGGLGENAAQDRAMISAGLECLGLELDAQANDDCRTDADVARRSSRGRILVIATREDETMLQEVMRVLDGSLVTTPMERIKQRRSEYPPIV